MNDNTIDLDQTKEETPAAEVSDEALESAGQTLSGTGPTYGTCTGGCLYLC